MRFNIEQFSLKDFRRAYKTGYILTCPGCGSIFCRAHHHLGFDEVISHIECDTCGKSYEENETEDE